ncbi:unnamed protein product [Leuciscus chuanchicus]
MAQATRVRWRENSTGPARCLASLSFRCGNNPQLTVSGSYRHAVMSLAEACLATVHPYIPARATAISKRSPAGSDVAINIRRLQLTHIPAAGRGVCRSLQRNFLALCRSKQLATGSSD